MTKKDADDNYLFKRNSTPTLTITHKKNVKKPHTYQDILTKNQTTYFCAFKYLKPSLISQKNQLDLDLML